VSKYTKHFINTYYYYYYYYYYYFILSTLKFS